MKWIEVFKVNHFSQKIQKFWDEEGNEIEVAPHPQQIVRMRMDNPVKKGFLIRKKIGE